MANVEKLEAVMDHIRMNREQHDQRSWALKTECGTTMCFAGWTVALEGYDLKWRGRACGTYDEKGELVTIGSDWASYCTMPNAGNHRPLPVKSTAQSILGLTYDQMDALFYAKTFDDVENAVKDIINAEQAA